jgi:glycosyltransferase involved in cell wall biosynthesis
MTTSSAPTHTRPLTVVIPAYNVEGYIEEALISVLSQRWIDSIDIVVVDDGSSDSTYAQAQAVVERDRGEHIRLIHQSNRGVSDARNEGLAAVRTPYVAFLDGDDVFMENFSDLIVPMLAELEWDILEYNVAIIDDQGIMLEEIEQVPQKRAGGHAVDRATRMHFANLFHTFVWTRVYKTALFGPKPFPSGRHYEDAAAIPAVYLRARNIYQLADRLLGYRRRFGSITQQSPLRDVRDLLVTGDEALARCEGGEYDEYWMTIFYKLFRRACHVSARVDSASFDNALSMLKQMADKHRRALLRLPQPTGIRREPLGRFEFNVRVDRCAFFAKRLAKKVLRRELDRPQRSQALAKP